MSYTPSSEATRAIFNSLLATVKDLVPPNTSEAETEEVASYVVSTLRLALRSGGSDSLGNAKAALESYLGIILSEKQMRSLIEASGKLTDFVVVGEDDSARRKPAALQLQEEDSSSSSSDSSSESSQSDSDDEEGATATKKRRTEKGAETAFATLQLDEDDEGAATSTLIPMSKIQVNYIRDSRLKLLFPADSTEQREQKTQRILNSLSKNEENETIKTLLTSFFQSCVRATAANNDYDYLAVEIEMEVDFLVANRWTLVYGTQKANAAAAAAASAGIGTDASKAAERAAEREVMDRMKAHAIRDPRVAAAYQSATGINVNENARISGTRPLELIDLESLCRKGEKEGIVPALLKPVVPKGTRRGDYESHEEIVLPQCETYGNSKHGKRNLPELEIMKAFPQWVTRGFDIAKTRALNPMQSIVYPTAFQSNDNMLVCAPTGAGKTLVALMTILRVLDNYKSDNLGSDFHKDDFKIVYIAPMKALVQEVVQTFSARLEPFGIEVAELSGDNSLSQQQLARTQMIVATPEKWDIVTRKSTELSVANTVRLIIIDEVHLLHNDRGPILESIVARTILQQERQQSAVRLVGLSATLPNAIDVSKFLKVDKTKGFFNFDASFRPVPLQQTYCAVKKIPGKMHAEVLNSVTYTKTMQFEGQSVMIFVHSRKDTEFTANYVMQRALKEHQLSRLGIDTQGNRRFVEEEGADLRDSLKELIPNGFGIHHAGMSALERSTVERLFMEKKIKVLVCTSTLAWGVNLPTHAVIIKGTQIYSPQHKGTTYLSSLDVLQMFGRAGRKGFDTFGEACIITTPDDVQYYLCILNHQLDIESQFVNHLADGLNAEVALGNVTSIADGAAWLQHTYHYVRALKCPKQYLTQYSPKLLRTDPQLEAFRGNLIHSAALALAECQMVEYDQMTRTLKPTPLGRIASTYYIHYESMRVYNDMLKATSQEIDLYHIFSLSSEFKQISVRRGEQDEVKSLIEVCPIPIIDGYDYSSPAAKINVLLQCYITGANLKGMELMTEMVYIKDSAQRILKALYDMCVVRDFGITSRKVHQIYQNVLRHQWAVLCPLRQLVPSIKASVATHGVRPASVKAQLAELGALINEVERRKDMDFNRYRRYNYETLLTQVFDHNELKARSFYTFMKKVPRLLVEVSTRPISNTVLQMDIEIKMDVEYDPIVHDGVNAEMIVSVEDATLSSNPRSKTKCILYHEVMDASKLVRNGALDGQKKEDSDAANQGEAEVFDESTAADEGRPTITTTVLVPVSALVRPVHYFVHVMLSSWVGCSTVIPVPLVNIAMPASPPAPTSLEGFAAHLRAKREQLRAITREQRRRQRGENDFEAENENSDGDDDLTSNEISVTDAVGESLGAVAAAIFPFETLSIQQAAAAQIILSSMDENQWSGNVWVGMPAGTGKTFLAELLILRLLMENNLSSAGDDTANSGSSSPNFHHLLYLTATAAQAERRYTEWTEKFGNLLGQSVVLLTGNTDTDLKTLKGLIKVSQQKLDEAQNTVIIISCAANVTSLIQRADPVLRSIRYLIADHLHQLGTAVGGIYEAVVSRLMAKPFLLNGGSAARVLGLSYPVLYPQAIGDWIKAKKQNVLNYDNASSRRLKVTVEGSLVAGAKSRAEQQSRVALREIANKHDFGAPIDAQSSTVIFAPSAPDALKLARQLIEFRKQKQRLMQKDPLVSEKASTTIAVAKVVGGTGELSKSESLMDSIQNDGLRAMCQKNKVSMITNTTAPEDVKILLDIVALGEISLVVVTTREDAWRYPAAMFTRAVILASERLPVSPSASSATQQQQAFDCTAVEMVQMASRADRYCTVYCRQPRKWYWENFLCGPALMAVTSVLSTPEDYEIPFNNRIAEGTVTNLSQALSTFQSYYYYQLLKINPALFGYPNSDRATLTSGLSKMCDATCASLRDAGCIIYNEESGIVASTPVGTSAAQLCVSIDTVRTLLAVAGPIIEEAMGTTSGSTDDDNVSKSITTIEAQDRLVGAVVRLVCSLDEITNLPCASVTSSSERRLLLRIAQDLPSLNAIRTELTCTSAADKALVLCMMQLHKGTYDFAKSLPLYGRFNGTSSTSHDKSLTNHIVVDEEDRVVAAQMLRDAEEIITRAGNITTASVEIVGRQSFDAARAFIAANAALLVRALPSEILKTGHLAQISDTVLPGAIIREWMAANPSSPPPSINKLVSEATVVSDLALTFQTGLYSGSSLPMDPQSIEERKQITFAAASEVLQRAKIIQIVQRIFLGAEGHQEEGQQTTSINLSATAKIQLIHDILHLSITVAFDNFFLSSSAKSFANIDVPIIFWAVCYDGNNPKGPIFGIRPVSLSPLTQERTIKSEFFAPVPEDGESEGVELKVMLIPQNMVLLPDSGTSNLWTKSGIVANVEIVEDTPTDES